MHLKPYTTMPVRLRTKAFSFSPPEELAERMKLCTAWAYLRRGARLVREVFDWALYLHSDILRTNAIQQFIILTAPKLEGRTHFALPEASVVTVPQTVVDSTAVTNILLREFLPTVTAILYFIFLR